MKELFIFLLFSVLLLDCTAPVTNCPPCPCIGTGDTTVTVPPTKPNTDLEKIGICAFTWTPLERLDTFRQLRAFIATDFIWSERGLFVEPIKQSRVDVGAGLDTWLSNCQKRGIRPVLCVNQAPKYLGHEDPEFAPIQKGADMNKPESYRDFARVFAELAKRYGANKVDPKSTFVDTVPRWNNDPQNKRLTGLNLPLVLEVWNEPDKWWKMGTTGYFEPHQYAAMLSVCYDSIKKIDPKIMVAMGGLANWNLTYLSKMDSVFKVTRGGKWPCDIINVHHYSNAGNEYGADKQTWFLSGGIPPSQDRDFDRGKEVVKFARDRGKLVWVSEFGYDTKPPSWMHVKPVQGKADEKVQGEYLVQSYQAFLDMGFDGIFAFNGNDEYGAANGGLYQSSGILYGEATTVQRFAPKPAYFDLLEWIGGLGKK